MDYPSLIAELKRVANLSDFATRSDIPRRTLVRLRAGTGNPSIKTVQMVEQKLKEIRPKMNPRPPKLSPAQQETETA